MKILLVLLLLVYTISIKIFIKENNEICFKESYPKDSVKIY